jgi:hypothetical protein
MIHLLICATRRSGLSDRTFRSFRKNLFKRHQVNAILNVDPVGPDPDPLGVVAAVERYFNLVQWHSPDQPSFPEAFKRLWSAQIPGDYVFWLEDDWEMVVSGDLSSMIRIMDDNPDLAFLRLPWKPTGSIGMKNWKYIFPFTGLFFECPASLRREVGFCGHPSLIRAEFVRNCAPWIDGTKNPEKQFHYGRPELLQEVDRWRFGVFGFPNQPAAILDIGRDWMIKNGYRKAGSKAFFTQWENINA